MLSLMDSRELAIWRARDRIYRLGADADDERMGQIAAAVLQAAGVKVKTKDMSTRIPSSEEIEKEEADVVKAIERAHTLMQKGADQEQLIEAARRIGHNA